PPPFLGFFSVADRTQSKRSRDCISTHFVRFPDCQFVDRAEQLRHENGRMICCPVARTARFRGGRRGAKTADIAPAFW
ncbi:TPA: hypothetical protein ACHKJG_005212, partial [Escherichia coli]